MRKLVFLFCCLMFLTLPVSAQELHPPQVPGFAADRMPEDTTSFSQAVGELLRKALENLHPDAREAGTISLRVICAAVLCSILQSFSGPSKQIAETAAAILISCILLSGTNTLIQLGADTIVQLSEYEKLFLPVMTAALAAQGAATSSAVLYAGTSMFDLLLSKLISNLLVPLVYGYLALAIGACSWNLEILKKIQHFMKWLISWSLKTILTIFTAYLSLSGVVSGATDAIALKATKLTISTAVPVVGGILSDASEAILVSAGLMKNAAGIYGILAVLAIFLSPFLKIAVHFVVLKLTAILASLFGTKPISALVEDFSVAMGFLLAMTGASCLLLLISTVCFLRGVT